jgi:hypothetical protein
MESPANENPATLLLSSQNEQIAATVHPLTKLDITHLSSRLDN